MDYSKRVAGLMCVLIAGMGTMNGAAAGVNSPDYAAERVARAKNLTQPFGWFSLTALEWLKPGETKVGSAPDNKVVLADAPAHLATFEQKDGKVSVVAHDPSLLLHGAPLGATDASTLVSADEDEKSALASGTIRMWAIDRGGRRYLRIKDSQAPALKHFHGLRWYPANARYRIEARWVPSTQPEVMKVMNKLGQITPVKIAGHVEFELDGVKQTLTPMEAGKDGLWFVFRDQTYRQATDGGGRFLQTGPLSNGLDKPGTVVLDFNEAVNPPCAYSPFATCPLATKENRLAVKVPAGEKRYED